MHKLSDIKRALSSKHDVIVCSDSYTTVITTDVSRDRKMLLMSNIFNSVSNVEY